LNQNFTKNNCPDAWLCLIKSGPIARPFSIIYKKSLKCFSQPLKKD